MAGLNDRRGKGAIRVRYHGKIMKLATVCKEKGITRVQGTRMWHDAGCPDVVTEDFFAKVPKSHLPKMITILPDGLQMTAYRCAKEFRINHNTINNKVRKGQLQFTRDELEAMKAKRMPSASMGSTENYDDPEYLPNIVKGDLAHLSKTANRGNGKGEISDEEWINRIQQRSRGNTLNCLEKIFTGMPNYTPI